MKYGPRKLNCTADKSIPQYRLIFWLSRR